MIIKFNWRFSTEMKESNIIQLNAYYMKIFMKKLTNFDFKNKRIYFILQKNMCCIKTPLIYNIGCR